MNKIVVVFTMKSCPHCVVLKEMLDESGVEYVDRDIEEYEEMIRLKTAVLLAASLKIGAIAGCATDEQAYGVLAALNTLNIKVPEELKVVGFECLVVVSSALKILGGEVFTTADRERLTISVGRIQAAINASGIAI